MAEVDLEVLEVEPEELNELVGEVRRQHHLQNQYC